MDSNPSTEEGKEQEDQESNFFVKKQNEELKKANKELWKRVEDVQKENAKLKRKIDQSLSLSGDKYLDSILIFIINTAGHNIKIKTEGEAGSSTSDEDDELRKNLRGFQEKYSKTLKLLKVREMELDILKNNNDVVQIEC